MHKRVAERWAQRQSSQLDPPPAMVKKILAWVTDVYINQALPHLKYPDKAEARSFMSSPPDPSPIEPKWESIPLDLTGWRYEHLAKNTHISRKVSLNVNSWGTQGAAGSWSNRDWSMNFPLISSKGLGDWPFLKGYLSDLTRTVRHEAQHMAQSILDVMAGNSKHDRGLPGKGLRTPAWDQNKALDLFEGADYQDLHSMDDTEFYPVLQNAIDLSKDYLTQIPKNQWRDVVGQIVVGSKDTPPKLKAAADFFKTLRKYAPGKWRKAVGEFTKEVL